MHEYLWVELKGSKTPGIDLQGNVSTLPVAVLGQEARDYGMVLGLDFISDVKAIINVAAKVYSFLSNPSVTYPFRPGSASLPQNAPLKSNPNLHVTKPSPGRNLSLITSVPPPILTLEPVQLEVKDYINKAASDAHLQDEGKEQLRKLLETNPQVCTNQPGRTDVLQHTIYTTNCVPIKQSPYRMSAAE